MDNTNLNNVQNGTTPVTGTPEAPVTPNNTAPMSAPVPEFTPQSTPVPTVAGLNTNPIPTPTIEQPVVENTPVAPVAPTPEVPAAPTTPTPVEIQTTPVVTTPVAPTTSVVESAPVTPAAPVAPGPVANQQLQNIPQPVDPTQGYIPPVAPTTPAPKKDNSQTLIIIIIVAALVCILVFLAITSGDKKKENTNTTTTTTKEVDKTTSTSTSTTTTTTNKNPIGGITTTTTTVAPSNPQNSSLAWNEASYKGVTIKAPATKESFNGTGWTWDEDKKDLELKTGYTTSGGRIGEYPGGVVVGILNTSGETKKYQDCIIDSLTFYNPKDNSENVTFIGGLNYNSTIEQVKSTMKTLGHEAKLKERDYETSKYLKYNFNPDYEYRDYIEFYYYKDVLQSVTISVYTR